MRGEVYSRPLKWAVLTSQLTGFERFGQHLGGQTPEVGCKGRVGENGDKLFAGGVRAASSPENTVRLRGTFDEIDVIDLLPEVSTPTLVMHCRHDNLVPFEESRRIAALIPNAKFVSLESENHVPLPGEPAWEKFIAEMEAFLSD